METMNARDNELIEVEERFLKPYLNGDADSVIEEVIEFLEKQVSSKKNKEPGELPRNAQKVTPDYANSYRKEIQGYQILLHNAKDIMEKRTCKRSKNNLLKILLQINAVYSVMMEDEKEKKKGHTFFNSVVDMIEINVAIYQASWCYMALAETKPYMVNQEIIQSIWTKKDYYVECGKRCGVEFFKTYIFLNDQYKKIMDEYIVKIREYEYCAPDQFTDEKGYIEYCRQTMYPDISISNEEILSDNNNFIIYMKMLAYKEEFTDYVNNLKYNLKRSIQDSFREEEKSLTNFLEYYIPVHIANEYSCLNASLWCEENMFQRNIPFGSDKDERLFWITKNFWFQIDRFKIHLYLSMLNTLDQRKMEIDIRYGYNILSVLTSKMKKGESDYDRAYQKFLQASDVLNVYLQKEKKYGSSISVLEGQNELIEMLWESKKYKKLLKKVAYTRNEHAFCAMLEDFEGLKSKLSVLLYNELTHFDIAVYLVEILMFNKEYEKNEDEYKEIIENLCMELCRVQHIIKVGAGKLFSLYYIALDQEDLSFKDKLSVILNQLRGILEIDYNMDYIEEDILHIINSKNLEKELTYIEGLFVVEQDGREKYLKENHTSRELLLLSNMLSYITKEKITTGNKLNWVNENEGVWQTYLEDVSKLKSGFYEKIVIIWSAMVKSEEEYWEKLDRENQTQKRNYDALSDTPEKIKRLKEESSIIKEQKKFAGRSHYFKEMIIKQIIELLLDKNIDNISSELNEYDFCNLLMIDQETFNNVSDVLKGLNKESKKKEALLYKYIQGELIRQSPWNREI